MAENEEIQSILRTSHCFLGCTEADTNNYKGAQPHIQKWLDLVEKRTDGTGAQLRDFELGVAYNEVGGSYADNGDFDKAEEFIRRSIKTMKECKDFEPNWLGWPQPNLGIVLWVQGRLDEAKDILEDILHIFAKENGYDDTKSFKRVAPPIFSLK